MTVITLENEVWKDIKGYKGLYQVSDMGRVRSHKGILKQHENKYNYLFVCFCSKIHLVHRLVASVFIPNLEWKEIVNHKDCNKQNNKVDNLEWATQQENKIHAVENGRYKKGEKHYNAKLTEQQVKEIRKMYFSYGYTQRLLADIFHVSNSLICKIIKNEKWKSIS